MDPEAAARYQRAWRQRRLQVVLVFLVIIAAFAMAAQLDHDSVRLVALFAVAVASGQFFSRYRGWTRCANCGERFGNSEWCTACNLRKGAAGPSEIVSTEDKRKLLVRAMMFWFGLAASIAIAATVVVLLFGRYSPWR